MSHAQSNLLRLDASSRHDDSHSRQLGDYFVATWRRIHPLGQVVVRDLIGDPIPHISNDTIVGMFTPPDQLTEPLKTATALSDQLIAELKAADTILITVPMYNFGIPSSLKAWIDQISRIGHTFAFDGSNFSGLLKDKKVHLITSYGAAGYINGGNFSGANFVEPYLQFILGFLGMSIMQIYSIQSTTVAPASAEVDAELMRVKIDQMLNED